MIAITHSSGGTSFLSVKTLDMPEPQHQLVLVIKTLQFKTCVEATSEIMIQSQDGKLWPMTEGQTFKQLLVRLDGEDRPSSELKSIHLAALGFSLMLITIARAKFS